MNMHSDLNKSGAVSSIKMETGTSRPVLISAKFGAHQLSLIFQGWSFMLAML